ncbi:uncharacterized protein LOC128264712 [Drosophila gunungcola]|uniref:uncharacterized protein LOC128264712 n=1 Tax=Drosophila gunungcola TaxID=103775 RepID=UPI0022E5A7CF|nr:uncharacterized protein LOC128264712 [Drosophila gunungcola]
MDQFSHDLTLALEETSLMDRASGVGRWGSRRRTRSTGNLPCAPQPTEDSSSSPTDTLNALGHHGHHGHAHHPHSHTHAHPNANVDGLDTHNLKLPASDSDEKAPLTLPGRMGALESDSLNETTFSPARFYKPNSRRKRKIKRMSMEFEFSKDTPSPHTFAESPLQPGLLSGSTTVTGTIRKRLLKMDATGHHRSHLFFCGKRKRSNRDRYHEQESAKLYASSPHWQLEEQHLQQQHSHSHNHHQQQRMRPRSYSSTSKPLSDRLLPLNKGLLWKINRMAAQGQQAVPPTQKTDNHKDKDLKKDHHQPEMAVELPKQKAVPKKAPPPPSAEAASASAIAIGNRNSFSMDTIVPVTDIDALLLSTPPTAPMLRKKTPQVSGYNSSSSSKTTHRRRRFNTLPQPPLQLQAQAAQSMDCSELYDFLSSSSLSSSSDSEAEVGGHRRHDTDREGDDELTDWPGNEFGPGARYDPKRKLTKKSLLPQIRSDDTIGEDDTLMSGTEAGAVAMEPPPKSPAHQLPESLQDLSRFQPGVSEPIEILNASSEMETNADGTTMPHAPRQIESEMSGETSNPFLSSSPPGQGPVPGQGVREIRAGCRRINGERPGFSIKMSVNERIARFLQDPQQTQIRLPDIELYEPDSMCNLATLYSLTMVVERGCTVLTKTRNTTQVVSVDHPHQQGLQPRPDLFGDFKRRCYGEEEQQQQQQLQLQIHFQQDPGTQTQPHK